jgi:hypothetical protein
MFSMTGVARSRVVPYVLADAHRGAAIAKRHRANRAAGLEISILVEHVVGRQQRLRERLCHVARAQVHGGVEQRPAGLHARRNRHAKEHVWPGLERLRQPAGHLLRVCDEPRHQQQVTRRIAGQRHLGRDADVDAPLHGTHRGLDPGSIDVEGADSGVELEERDAHAAGRS